MGRGWKKVEVNDIKSLDGLEEIIRRNVNIKEDSGESSEGT